MTLEFIDSTFWTIIAIVLLFFFGKFALRQIMKRLLKFADDGDDSTRSIAERRAETLGNIFVNIGTIVIYAVILLLVLGLFGVDITPVLAGLGILGLALGFGAQNLVKDMVTGLFILVENQYDVDDKVKIGSFTGIVIKITIRSTALRDEDGSIYYISNGSIKDVINYSQKT